MDHDFLDSWRDESISKYLYSEFDFFKSYPYRRQKIDFSIYDDEYQKFMEITLWQTFDKWLFDFLIVLLVYV